MLSWQTKLKICLSYYQVITQVDRVYSIVFPPGYAKVLKALNAVFYVFFNWLPGVATACTGLRLQHELLLLCAVPLAIVLVVLIVTTCRRKPLVSALPPVLGITFFCFPFVSSRGFRAIAPCDCFAYADRGEVCFLRDAYSIECERKASGEYAAPFVIRIAAWTAILGYAGLVPLLYAGLLLVSRRALRGGPSTALSRSLHPLTKDYTHAAYWWELVDVCRKLALTGFLALLRPGSILQLYAAVIVVASISLLQLYTAPYHSLSDNLLSLISALALVLTFLASLGIQLTALNPTLSELGVQLTGIEGASSLDIIIAVLIGSALSVLMVAFSMFASSLAAVRALPIARRASDGTFIRPRGLAIGNYHAFISHEWAHGQDQARAMKELLVAFVPGLRVFLDVDDLIDISQLEGLIDASDVIIVFLTGSIADSGMEQSAYMRSFNCMRELRRAVQTNSPLVFVRETDQRHGAVSMPAHRRDCPTDLCAALDAHPVIPWYRVKDYLHVSLRLIIERVLNTKVRIPGALLDVTLHLASPSAGHFHLYVPSGNHGAAEVAELLHEEANRTRTELSITSDEAHRHLAQLFVLYLSGSNLNDLAQLHREIIAALDCGQQLLLIHEQRDSHDAVPFATIIERTPQTLRLNGIYDSTAIPLYEGEEFQRVCLQIMLRPLGRIKQDWLRHCFSARMCCRQVADEVTVPLSPSMPPSFRASWSSNAPGGVLVPAGVEMTSVGDIIPSSTGGAQQTRQHGRFRGLLTGRTESRTMDTIRVRRGLGADI